MTHPHLLAEIRAQLASGEIQRSDIEQVLEESQTGGAAKKTGVFHLSGATLLYAVGGIILLTGILFLIAQVWEDVGSLGRVLLTCGVAFVSLAAAIFVEEWDTEKSMLSTVLFGIGGILLTPGIFVFLYEYGGESDSLWVPTAVFGMLSVVYALLRYTYHNVALTCFAIAHATLFLYAFTGASFEDSSSFYNIYEILTLVIGAAYLALSVSLAKTSDSNLVRPVIALGTLGVLGSLFALMLDYTALQLVYPFAVLGMYYLGIQWERRTILILASLFFVGYISYITAEYFADSIGWPLALIFLGSIFLGLGYITLQITKKFEK